MSRAQDIIADLTERVQYVGRFDFKKLEKVAQEYGGWAEFDDSQVGIIFGFFFDHIVPAQYFKRDRRVSKFVSSEPVLIRGKYIVTMQG